MWKYKDFFIYVFFGLDQYQQWTPNFKCTWNYIFSSYIIDFNSFTDLEIFLMSMKIRKIFIGPKLKRWQIMCSRGMINMTMILVKSATVASRNRLNWGPSSRPAAPPSLEQSPKVQKRRQFSGVLKVRFLSQYLLKIHYLISFSLVWYNLIWFYLNVCSSN